jgi:SAM-dependent methyltransferase
MDDDVKAQHGGSFGAVAEDYAAARPSYPAEAVEWLTGPAPLDVVDLGAGTGKLTELLVAAGHRVTAVDPSAGMLEQLHRRLPEVITAEGPAEQVPLPDACCDVVTAAQAWHWFDQREAPLECARLLRPGGRLALVWNQREDAVEWVQAVWEPVNRSGVTGLGLLPEGWAGAVVVNGPFSRPEVAVFRHDQPISRDGILRLIASRSSVAVMEEQERRSLLAEVTEILDTHPATKGRDHLVIEYETHCYRWKRV